MASSAAGLGAGAAVGALAKAWGRRRGPRHTVGGHGSRAWQGGGGMRLVLERQSVAAAAAEPAGVGGG